MGFPVTHEALLDSVNKLVDESHSKIPFINNRPDKNGFIVL